MTKDTKSKKILIPTEIKNRELSSKLLLAALLADRGHDVYLGNKIQHTALDKIDPDIYFELSGKDHVARFRQLKEHGIKTVVLETEGAAFHGVEKFSELVGADTLKYTDCYCAWGTVAEKTVRNIDPSTRVEVTGNPRFDLLQEPLREFYAPTATELKKEHGEFILFNTNFAFPLGSTSPKEKLSHFEDTDPHKNHIREGMKKQTRILGEFLRLIAETADEFPDTKIILRPHPSSDPSLYKNCFYVYDNIEVTRELEARPWIMAAEVVIHNSCTTGVTSALLETPVIAYLPDGLEFYQTDQSSDSLSLPNEVSDKCRTLQDMYDIIRAYVFGERSFVLDEDRKSSIKRHINNVNYLSVNRIADIIDSMMFDDSERQSLPIDNKLRARRTLTRAVGSKRFEQVYIKSILGENRNKFPYTSTSEVKNIIERYPSEIKPEDLEIERLPYVVNGFRLWCDREN